MLKEVIEAAVAAVIVNVVKMVVMMMTMMMMMMIVIVCHYSSKRILVGLTVTETVTGIVVVARGHQPYSRIHQHRHW